MKKRVRIIDIAKKAGVSKGTVDRVIHKRGHVSEEARRKVEQAMKQMDYQPNLIASSLAYNKIWRIAYLAPDPDNDVFWSYPRLGTEQALQSIQDFGFSVEFFHFPDADNKAFSKQSERVLSGHFDAVIVAPIFAKEANRFFDRCQRIGLPYVQINTLIERDDSNFLWYIGQDSYHSGVLAAKLLHFGLEKGDSVLILHLEKGVYNSYHLVEKERGFEEYFIEKAPEVHVIRGTFENPKDQIGLLAFVQNQIEKYPNIRGIFVTTSKLHYLVDALQPIAKWPELKLVGFDLIPQNLEPLHHENIHFLINQNPQQQGFIAMMNIFNYLVAKKEFPKIQYLPLHIVMKENVQYYLESPKKIPVFI